MASQHYGKNRSPPVCNSPLDRWSTGGLLCEHLWNQTPQYRDGSIKNSEERVINYFTFLKSSETLDFSTKDDFVLESLLTKKFHPLKVKVVDQRGPALLKSLQLLVLPLSCFPVRSAYLASYRPSSIEYMVMPVSIHEKF